MAHGVGNVADHADDVTLCDIDGGVGTVGGVGATDIVYVGGVFVVVVAFDGAEPEVGVVPHAELQIRFVELAVFVQKEFAGGRVAQKMFVEIGNDGGQVLFDDRARADDGLFIGRGEADKFCHVAKVFACVGRAALGGCG